MAQRSGKLGMAAVALLVLGPACAHFGVTSAFTGFKLFGLGGALGLAALLTGVVALVRRGLSAAVANLALGALAVGTLLALALPSRSFPRINDITTDPANPPTFVAAATLAENQARDLSYPADFAAQQQAGYPGLAPLALAMPPEEAFAKVVATARATADWRLLREDPATRAVEGVATSRLFRFQDDFVIEVRAAETGGSLVQMRSKSRDGRGDMGANAARIEAFFARLRTAG